MDQHEERKEAMSNQYDPESILDPRDLIEIERMVETQQRRQAVVDEIIDRPAEIALSAMRRVTDWAYFWKMEEERWRFEADALRYQRRWLAWTCVALLVALAYKLWR